jgi:ferredoxin
MMRIARRRG